MRPPTSDTIIQVPPVVLPDGQNRVHDYSLAGARGLRLAPVPGRLSSSEPERFTGEITRLHFGAIALSSSRFGSCSFRGEASDVDLLCLLHVRSGHLALRSAAEGVQLGAGDVLVMLPGSGVELSADGSVEFHAAYIPTTRLPARVVQEAGVPRVMASSDLTGAFAAFVTAAIEGGVGDPRHAARAASGVIAFVVALLEPEGPSEGTGTNDTRHVLAERARAHIDERVTDPLLTPQTLAAALGVGRRTLYYAMSSEGSSPGEYLRDRRLDLVLRQLEAAPDASTASIAQACGFGGAAHLSRLFKARYGVSVRTFSMRGVALGATTGRSGEPGTSGAYC